MIVTAYYNGVAVLITIIDLTDFVHAEPDASVWVFTPCGDQFQVQKKDLSGLETSNGD